MNDPPKLDDQRVNQPTVVKHSTKTPSKLEQTHKILLDLNSDIYEYTLMIKHLEKERYVKAKKCRELCFKRANAGEINTCNSCNAANKFVCAKQKSTITPVGYSFRDNLNGDYSNDTYCCGCCGRPCLGRTYREHERIVTRYM